MLLEGALETEADRQPPIAPPSMRLGNAVPKLCTVKMGQANVTEIHSSHEHSIHVSRQVIHVSRQVLIAGTTSTATLLWSFAMTLKLYQWPSNGDVPNGGIFCMKLETYLKLTDTPHEVVPTRSMSQSPKGTMPFIERSGSFMSDSQLIIEMLERESKAPLDGFLKPEQRAESNAYRRMVEFHLANILISFRWVPDEGWNQFSRQIFAGAPAPIRLAIGGIMRRSTTGRLKKMGIARHSLDELTAFAKADLESLSLRLGDRPFFFGDKPSTLDITVYSVLGNILYDGVEKPLVAAVRAFPNLVAHTSRVMKAAFGRDFKAVA
jgi:glutathione S-transferase